MLFPSFLFVIEHMMPLCMVISWVYSVAMMIQHIVSEKEQRLKEVSVELLLLLICYCSCYCCYCSCYYCFYYCCCYFC